MSIYKKIFSSVCAIVIVLLLLTGFYAFRIKQYHSGFSEVEPGQPKERVMDLMGKASESRNCSVLIYDANKKLAGQCFEILTYNGFYEQWAFAFDKDGNLIEKYYRFLGEYGDRPPGTI